MEDFLSEAVRAEAVLLLSSCFIGMVYGFVYDTIRIVRRVIVHRSVFWIAAEDIVFWVAVAVHAYVTFYQSTGGVFRGYIVTGIIGGASLYRAAAGRYYVRYIGMAWRIFKRYIKNLQISR